MDCPNCFNDRRVCRGYLCPFRLLSAEQYMNVRAVYGRNNYATLFNRVPGDQEEVARRCILTEARARVRDPIRGITGVLENLREDMAIAGDSAYLVVRSLSEPLVNAVATLRIAWDDAQHLQPWQTTRLLVIATAIERFLEAGRYDDAVAFVAQEFYAFDPYYERVSEFGLMLMDRVYDMLFGNN